MLPPRVQTRRSSASVRRSSAMCSSTSRQVIRSNVSASHGSPSRLPTQTSPHPREAATAALLEHKLSAHPLGQLATDRQPQSKARLPTRVPTAHEPFEDQLPLLVRDARPVVAHAQRGAGTVSELDLDLPAFRAQTDRVVEQDAEDLGDAARIP